MYTLRKLWLGYAALLGLLLITGLTCSNESQPKYKQSLVKYQGAVIENVTFNCDLNKRLHFVPNATLRHCIFKWNGPVDMVWCPEFTSRNIVAVLTGSNLKIDECMFVGSGSVNPVITSKQ